LLPINGRKLLDDYRSGLTLRQSHQADNLWLLACYDIGVVCGPRSHNLVSIWFGEEKERAEFLDLNPSLRNTLLTSSPGQGQFSIWLRIDGWYPESHQKGTYHWAADKLHIVATREPDSKYPFDNLASLVTLKFKEIVWPDVLAIYWASTIANMEYEIVVANRHGNPVLNDDYVGSVFINMHPNIFFNPGTGTFYERLPDGQNQTYYEEQVKKSLHAVLSYIRKAITIKLTVKAASDAIGKAPVFVDTGLKHLAELVELLKIVAVRPIEVPKQEAAKPAVAEATGFENFVQTQLEEAPGASVAVEEAYEAYTEFCISEGHPRRYGQRQFQDRIGAAVKGIHGIDKNHRTIRNGLHKRGFFNLRLKSGAGSNPGTVGTLGTDGTVAFMEGMNRCHSDLTAFLATVT
jgi:hypothetical protein